VQWLLSSVSAVMKKTEIFIARIDETTCFKGLSPVFGLAAPTIYAIIIVILSSFLFFGRSQPNFFLLSR
jgi:hypothetical protein